MMDGDLVKVIAPEEVDGSLLYEDKVGEFFTVKELYVRDGEERAVLGLYHPNGEGGWREVYFNLHLSCLEGLGSIPELMGDCEVKEYILDDEDIVLAQVRKVKGKIITNIVKILPDLGAHLPKLKWYQRLCKCAFCSKRFPQYRILDPNVFPDNDVGDKDTWKVCGACRIYISGTLFEDASKTLEKKMGGVE